MKLSNKLIVAIALITSCVAQAADSSPNTSPAINYKAPNFSVTGAMKGSEIEVIAKAVKKYHFNLDAPHYLSTSGSSDVRIKTKEESASTLAFDIPNTSPFTFSIHAFVCDDINTFCEKHEVSAKWDGHKVISGKDKAASPETPSTETIARSELSRDEHGFWVNQPEKAFALAKEKNLPVLIDFYGIWCPPCNELNEEVFGATLFQKQAKHFVLLKLDADSPLSWKLKSQYKIAGYPTLLLTTSSGEEISRILGFREVAPVVRQMKTAFGLKDISYAQLKAKADQGNRESMDRLGQIGLDQQDFALAAHYLTGTERLQERLWDAKIGAASSNEKVDQKVEMIHQALNQFPHSPSALDWLEGLIQSYDDAKQTELKKQAQLKEIALAQELLKKPELFQDHDLSKEDLLEEIADTQEDLGDPNAKTSYRLAAQAYLAKIRSVHLENERGYNLEYAFCLWKSGDEDAARSVYEKLRERYPSEFTFHYLRANMEFKLHHIEQAQSPAEQAFKNSYGDNRLRSGLLLAKILKALGKVQDAKDTIAQTLASVKLPDDPSIRSSRYLKAIQEFQKNDLMMSSPVN